MIEITKIKTERIDTLGQKQFTFFLKAPRTYALTDNKLILGYPLEFKELRNLGEAVVFSLLPIAFTEASDITLPDDLPIEEKTQERVSRIYALWNKWFSCNRKIKIQAKCSDSPANLDSNRGGAQLFSGGIDSLATFKRRKDEIGYLVFYYGADIRVSSLERCKEVSEHIERFAENHGKKLITIMTNIHYLHPVSWEHVAYACAMLGPTLALSNYIDKVFIASGFSGSYAKRIPWGSHPDLVPLIGSNNVEAVYDGIELKRTDKILQLSDDVDLLKNIRVCCRDLRNRHNCGECEKCLRTTTALKSLGVNPSDASFPEESFSFKRISEFLTQNTLKDYEKLFWCENLELIEGKSQNLTGCENMVSVLKDSLGDFYKEYRNDFPAGLPKSFEYISKWRKLEKKLKLKPDSLMKAKRLFRVFQRQNL